MHSRLRRAVAAFSALLTSMSLASCGSGGDPRNFNLSVTPSEVTVVADYTTPPFTLAVSPLNGFEGDVQLTAEPAAGLECAQPTCTQSTASGASFRFNTNTTLASGEYPIVFHGAGGKYPHDVTAYVKVLPYDGSTPPPDFDMDVQPARYLFSTPARGVRGLTGTLNYQITFIRYNHYTGPITVSVAVYPQLSCAPCTATTTGDSATLSVVVDGADPEVYTNTFTATAANVTKTATAVIVITPPPTLPPSGAGPTARLVGPVSGGQNQRPADV